MRNIRMVVSGLLFLAAALAAAEPAVLLERSRLPPADGAPDGGFGRSVAIDGDVAVVTANATPPFWGVGPPQPGAAYVFERNEAGVWQQTAKLTPVLAQEGDLFGFDVAVEGNVIVVGAPFSYRTHVFEKSASGWNQTAVLGGTGVSGTGNSVAIANGVIAISNGADHGMVLYGRGPGGWAQIVSYRNGVGENDGDYLGPDVDVATRFAIHGSWGSEFDPPTPSTAFIYDAGENGDWSNPIVTALTRPGGGDYPDGFASNVSIAGNTALIGGVLFERDASDNWLHTGEAEGGQALDSDGQTVIRAVAPYQFHAIHQRGDDGSWSHAAELVTSDGASLARIDIDQGRVVAAGRFEAEPWPTAVYIFELPADLVRPALLQDDFQDGDANGWSTTPGSLFAVAAGDASRVYRQTALAGNAAALLQAASGDDQSIQVDVTPRGFNGPDRWYGLVARYTDSNNYYYVTARSGGSLQLKKMIGGAYVNLGSATLPVALGRTNRLRLEAIGDHVRVFVDDKPVIRVRDGDLSGGVPGLMTYKARADYDNVVFNTNPANIAFVDTFGTPRLSWHAAAGAWTRIVASGLYRQSDVTGGARAVISGAAVGSFSSGTYGNQIVQADLRPTEFAGADRWFGLMARYVDDGNYHYVTLRSSNVIYLRKLVNGAVHTLATAPLDVELNSSYRVRLESVGTRLRAYVDDALILEATDPTVTPQLSSAGVAMYKTAADVDNFSLVQP